MTGAVNACDRRNDRSGRRRLVPEGASSGDSAFSDDLVANPIAFGDKSPPTDAQRWTGIIPFLIQQLQMQILRHRFGAGFLQAWHAAQAFGDKSYKSCRRGLVPENVSPSDPQQWA
ncbi:hypothetical protein AFK24_01260 [Pseudomonas syringae]|uniref:Uncharacterized protein n=1 Tax=Pseudomonas syringae TaxID=317 RepID=A0A1C7Z9P5_PSESX|nr:hypothetical protein AFK24_01260 [Pseudomonas syringae]